MKSHEDQQSERLLPNQPDFSTLYRGEECNRVFKFYINYWRNAESMSTMPMKSVTMPRKKQEPPSSEGCSFSMVHGAED